MKAIIPSPPHNRQPGRDHQAIREAISDKRFAICDSRSAISDPKGDNLPIIQTENLTKIYGTGEAAVVALDHLNMVVQKGEFLAVMGPSGCGKSTLLHLVGGLDRPTEGRVLLDGRDLTALRDDDLAALRRRRIGFVFQFYNLIPVLTALENAALPLLLDGVKPAEAHRRAAEWLQRLGMGDRLHYRPDQLSGGQQQRVAIARFPRR